MVGLGLVQAEVEVFVAVRVARRVVLETGLGLPEILHFKGVVTGLVLVGRGLCGVLAGNTLFEP